MSLSEHFRHTTWHCRWIRHIGILLGWNQWHRICTIRVVGDRGSANYLVVRRGFIRRILWHLRRSQIATKTMPTRTVWILTALHLNMLGLLLLIRLQGDKHLPHFKDLLLGLLNFVWVWVAASSELRQVLQRLHQQVYIITTVSFTKEISYFVFRSFAWLFNSKRSHRLDHLPTQPVPASHQSRGFSHRESVKALIFFLSQSGA